jgi:hypothetical protein
MVKTWRLKNINPTQKWPQGCRVVNVGGETFGAPTCGVLVPALEANATAEISIPLVAPARSGRCIGYFRLITPDNHRFGHRLWIDVTVDGSLGEQIAATVARPFRIIGDQLVARVQEYEIGRNSAQVASSSDIVLGNVVTPPPSSASQQDEDLRRYSIEVQSLVDMGFHDVAKNVELLRENNGDLETVLAALLSAENTTPQQ